MKRACSWQGVIAGIGLCALAGCSAGSAGISGGGGGPVDPVEPAPVTNPYRAEFLAANTARSDLFEHRRSLDNTEEAAMPASGEVVYSGFGSVAMQTAGTGFMAIGEARITADFRTSALDGTIANFLGRTMSGNEAPYAGTLVLAGETGGAAYRDNRFTATVTGTLTGAGRTLLIDSDLSGGFRGEAHDVLFGTTDTGQTILVDGVRMDGTVQIIADR